jgi:hypothetical protein
MSNMVTGRVSIRINGQYQRSKSGAKLQYSDVKRSAQVGNEVHGFTEEASPPRVEFTISHKADTSLDTYKNITDTTISFTTDTGRNFVLNNAWCTGEIELTSGAGEVSLAFEALTCVEV